MFGVRVVLAVSESPLQRTVRDMLSKTGCLIVAAVEDGRSALQATLNSQPDLLLMNSRLPGMNCYEIANIVTESRAAAIVLISDSWETEVLEQAKQCGVLGFVVKPVSEAVLLPTLEIALASFQRIRDLEKEVDHLKKHIATRKVVEKAKGILMKKRGWSEAEAFRWLQQQSMKKRASMKAIAEAILITEQ
jgi:AmiR/NasT family two-component response regulator